MLFRPAGAGLWDCARVLAPLFAETTEVRGRFKVNQESRNPLSRKLESFSCFPHILINFLSRVLMHGSAFARFVRQLPDFGSAARPRAALVC